MREKEAWGLGAINCGATRYIYIYSNGHALFGEEQVDTYIYKRCEARSNVRHHRILLEARTFSKARGKIYNT